MARSVGSEPTYLLTENQKTEKRRHLTRSSARGQPWIALHMHGGKDTGCKVWGLTFKLQ